MTAEVGDWIITGVNGERYPCKPDIFEKTYEVATKESACDGYGCNPAKFMFVGISAGRLGALVTRVPFTKDASGRIFQRCLGKLGLSRSDEFSLSPQLVNCYITNLVKARVLTEGGLNRLPTPKEIEAWIPTFRSEVEQVQPTSILALGDLVYRRLRTIYPERMIKRLRHPRWYQSHGALAEGSRAFDLMVEEYGKAIH